MISFWPLCKLGLSEVDFLEHPDEHDPLSSSGTEVVADPTFIIE